MTRSSRHRSHKEQKRSSKYTKYRTDSEEDESSKDRKVREEANLSSGPRASKHSESGEKRKAGDPQDGDYYRERVNSKRRKDRADPIFGPDQDNEGEAAGGESLVGKEDAKSENAALESLKVYGSKVSIDSKNRPSRRHESGSGRKENSFVVPVEKEGATKGSGKLDLSQKTEKYLKESLRLKDVKGGRWTEGDEKVQDGRRERSTGIDVNAGGGTETNMQERAQADGRENYAKKASENTGRQLQDKLLNPDLEKDYEKYIRRDESGAKDAGNDDYDNRLSTREDCRKNGKYKSDGCKDQHQEDHERSIRYTDYKHRREDSSKDHMGDRSDSTHFKGESLSSESRHKKAKLQDADSDCSHVNARGVRHKNNSGREMSSDPEVHGGIKSRSAKQQRRDEEKNASSGSNLDSPIDRRRSESYSCHLDALGSVGNAQHRYGSKGEYIYRDLSGERHYQSSLRNVPKKFSNLQTVGRPKCEVGIHSSELPAERVVRPRCERFPISDRRVSPVQLTEKSPSSTSLERRDSNRTSAKRSFDLEEIGNSRCGSKDDLRDYTLIDNIVQEFPFEKPVTDDFSQADSVHRESTSVGSSFNRIDPIISSSLSPRPPPPLSHGVDIPSMGPFEDDSSGQTGDRKFNYQYKRNGDSSSTGRGQGIYAWRSAPNWAGPVTCGFSHFQHGQYPTGFHPVVQQFPPLFGVRPSMELNHAGMPWHDSSHPFGWLNPVDDSFPHHLQGWDGNNGAFGEEPHMYGRLDWDFRRHLSNHCWEMSMYIWKGQNGNVNKEYLIHREELDYSGRVSMGETWGGWPSGQRVRNEQIRPERFPAESIEIKQTSNTLLRKTANALPTFSPEKMLEPSKPSTLDDNASFCPIYLSKLDISADLTFPELYTKGMNLMGKYGGTASESNTTKDTYVEEDPKVGAKSYDLGALLFPAYNETVLQICMALYQKQKEEMKMKFVPDPVLRKVSEVTDKELVGHVEDPSKAANSHLNKENACCQINLSTKLGEGDCDTISDGFVIADCHQVYEGLMPKMLIASRVNVCRIHNSPENTH